jgi:hypothetical protein
VPPIRYRLWSWAGRRCRTLSVLAVLAAVAVAVALTLVAGTLRTLTAADRLTADWGSTYDVGLQQDSGRPRATELSRLDAVASIDIATFVFGGLQRGDQQADALVFVGTPEAVGTRVVEGRSPDADHPGEFLASRSFMTGTGAELGDEFHLITLTQEQGDTSGFDTDEPAGPSLDATLVGVIAGPGDDLDGDGYAIALFPSALLDVGDIGVSGSQAAVALAPGATIDDLRAQIDALPQSQVFSLSPAEIVPADVREAVNVQGQGLGVLAAIVTIAALAVLGQVLSRQLRLTTDERSVLRGLGYTRGQLRFEQASRAAVVVLAGTLAAAALAYAASGTFPTALAGRVEPAPGRRLDLAVHALGAVAFGLALVLWVTLSHVADARRARAVPSAGLIERLVPSLPSAPATTALRFAFGSSTGVARGAKTPLVGITLVCCVLFGALTFGTNLRAMVDDPSTYGVNFDLGLGQGGDEIPADVQADLTASPDVAGLTLYGTTSLVIDAESLAVIGMRPLVGSLVPEVVRGRLPVGDDEIALGPVAARDLGLDVGDELRGTGAAGPRTLRVTGVALIPGIGGADVLGEVGLVTEGGFTSLDPDATMGEAAIGLTPDAPPGAAERISALTGMAAGQFDRPSKIANLDRIRTIPSMVALAVGALGVLSLGQLMLVAVWRRRRDFAVLRAVGAPRRWLTSVVHWQATLTSAVILGVALPAGALAGASLHRRLAEQIGTRPASSAPILELAATFAGLLVLANLAAAVAAHRVRRDSPSEVLADL